MDAHIDAMTALPADVADENATRTCAATNSMVHNLSDSETLEDGEVMAMNEIEANAIVETQVLASGSSVCMHNSKQHMSPVLVTDAMQQQQQSTPTLIMSDLQIALSAAISTTGTCAVPDEPSIPSRNALKTLEDIACSSTVKVMATVATDSDESDSSDSSMSSVSDSTSTDSAHSELDVRRRVLDDVDIDEDENGTSSKEAPRTKNELVQPMVKKPDIVRVPDDHDLVEVGRVHAVVGTVVVVESALITGAESGDGSSNDALPRPIARPVTAALDAGSIVAFADRTVLGEIHETFGPVHQPLYSILFNRPEDIDRERVVKGAPVFQCPHFSKIVLTAMLRQMKGSDASNIHDEEVPEGEQEYSDDEKEQQSKLQQRKRKKNQVVGSGTLADQQTHDRRAVGNLVHAQRQIGQHTPTNQWGQERREQEGEPTSSPHTYEQPRIEQASAFAQASQGDVSVSIVTQPVHVSASTLQPTQAPTIPSGFNPNNILFPFGNSQPARTTSGPEQNAQSLLQQITAINQGGEPTHVQHHHSHGVYPPSQAAAAAGYYQQFQHGYHNQQFYQQPSLPYQQHGASGQYPPAPFDQYAVPNQQCAGPFQYPFSPYQSQPGTYQPQPGTYQPQPGTYQPPHAAYQRLPGQDESSAHHQPASDYPRQS